MTAPVISKTIGVEMLRESPGNNNKHDDDYGENTDNIFCYNNDNNNSINHDKKCHC